MLRSLSDIKLYHESELFEPEEGHVEMDYQGIHEFENYIDAKSTYTG